MLTLRTNDDIFDLPNGSTEALLVTTNSQVKQNGHAVMGKGIALKADQIFHVSGYLGEKLKREGNHVYWLCRRYYNGRLYNVISFPTKDHWRYPSKIELIKQSCVEVMRLAIDMNLTKIYLPPVGCGNGGLKWETQVEPVLKGFLSDNFIAVLPVE